MFVRKRHGLILSVVLIIIQTLTSAAYCDEINWLAVGSLHDWFSSAGCEIEVGRRHRVEDQQDGLRWPARFPYQDMKAAKGLWIGATDYYDPLVEQQFDHKVVHIGPRFLHEGDEIMPQQFTVTGRFDHPLVIVDGETGSSLLSEFDNIDAVDPKLPADRILYNTVNTSMGITITRKIYAFTQQYHDNYYIYEYTFKNTGIVGEDEIYSQTLQDVIVSFLYRYAPTREVGAFGYYWLPQSVTWGHNTMLDTMHLTENGSFSNFAQFAWHGLHSGAAFDNIGGPNGNGNGQLGAAQHVGVVTIHADNAANDPSHNPQQPANTWFIQSDVSITQSNDQFDGPKMTMEYNFMSSGHPNQTHAEYVGDGYADKWALPGGTNPGGYSNHQAFGPYTLEPGESIKVVLAEGVAGLSRDSCYTIGDRWLNGSAPFRLPDGSTTNDPDTYKNAWVFTGRDSLKQAFTRAIGNYNSGFDIPNPPPPPMTFEVRSDTGHIALFWGDNAENNANFAGYRIYRASARHDTIFQEIFACGTGTNHPGITNSHNDYAVEPETDYYYAIVSFDDGTSSAGTVLHSSQYWTQTDRPARLRDIPWLDADVYVAPDGDDNNSGLTAADPLKHVAVALERIYSNPFNPNTIYLASGVYSPSATGENYPLPGRDYVTISGNGPDETILDAEEQANVFQILEIDSFAVQHVKVANGYGSFGLNSSWNGGGIYCYNSSLVMYDIFVTQNTAEGGGGGIYINNNSDMPASVRMSQCRITHNTSQERGGGIYLGSPNVLFLDSNYTNSIYSNSSALLIGDDVGVGNTHLNLMAKFPLDTFTVASPSDYYAYPSSKISFDIQHGLIEQYDADLYVSPTGDDGNSGLSPAQPLRTITSAIQKITVDSLSPHNIYLDSGIYSPSTSGEHYPLYCRDHISIIGDSIERSILDAEETARVVDAYYDKNVQVNNVTIQNGYDRFGGGINASMESDLIFHNCLVTHNSADNDGGGVSVLSGSKITLCGTVIRENSAGIGGGISFWSGATAEFDSVNRSSIYLNHSSGISGLGKDLYALNIDPISIILDTFTVKYPRDEYVVPLASFTFDILHGVYRQEFADLYVSPDGSDSNSGLIRSEALKTIGFALSTIYADSTNPHAIYLANGVYSSSTNGENFPLEMEDYVSLRGVNADSVRLDASEQNRVIELRNRAGVRLEGLTIQRGNSDEGGGIYTDNTDLSLKEVVIQNSSAEHGGGLYARDSNIEAIGSVFRNNTTDQFGAGIYADNSFLDLYRVVITGNTAGYWGSGLYSHESDLNLLNATISFNNGSGDTDSGIGLYSNSKANIINSILWNPDMYELIVYYESKLIIAYSNCQDTSGGILSRGELVWGGGIIGNEPGFIGGEPFNFHLAEGSACVNRGTALFVHEGDTLVNIPDSLYIGSAPDLGAFESDFISDISEAGQLPEQFALHQNYPNPFNPTTQIQYELAEDIHVKVTIYDLLGKKVTVLVNKQQEAGHKSVTWNGTDQFRHPVASGVYLYKIEAGDYAEVKKMILLR